MIERHIQLIIQQLKCLQRDSSEPLPEFCIFLMSKFKSVKSFPRLIIKNRVFFSLFMKMRIKLKEFFYRVSFNSCLFSPLHIGNDKLSKLCAPVSEVIDACDFRTILPKYFRYGISEYRCALMPHLN